MLHNREHEILCPMAVKLESAALEGLWASLQQSVEAIARNGGAAGTPKVELVRPTEEQFGDYTTNVALMLAPLVGRPPRDVATELAEAIQNQKGVRSVDVAGPGFVNMTMHDDWYSSVLASVLESGDEYGASPPQEAGTILLEFVSPNPTGPLVAASARHAAFGDSLARLLRAAGYSVVTECYLNDTGRQVQLFGESIVARATGKAVPEGGYEGDYVIDLANQLNVSADDNPEDVGRRAVQLMIEGMQDVLGNFGVSFDNYKSELELHSSGRVTAALDRVKALGQTFDEDGATWLRTTAYGDDKDRTIIRSNGTPTYFAADIGYIEDKYERASQLIYLLGADHHGYIARLRAAAQCLGHDPETCEVIIMQMVNLIEQGEHKKMSKRRGDFVPMKELIDRIGVDAARFFMLQRSHDSHLDLDLDLAASESDQNPVYYVQYAHARIRSIERKAAEEGLNAFVDDVVPSGDALSELVTSGGEFDKAERRLLRRIAEFPVAITDAADRRAPHRIVHYVHDLAGDFSSFYHECRVTGDGIAEDVSLRRLAICRAARIVTRNCLEIIGVSAPEKM